jgi:hypothetical protein
MCGTERIASPAAAGERSGIAISENAGSGSAGKNAVSTSRQEPDYGSRGATTCFLLVRALMGDPFPACRMVEDLCSEPVDEAPSRRPPEPRTGHLSPVTAATPRGRNVM